MTREHVSYNHMPRSATLQDERERREEREREREREREKGGMSLNAG